MIARFGLESFVKTFRKANRDDPSRLILATSSLSCPQASHHFLDFGKLLRLFKFDVLFLAAEDTPSGAIYAQSLAEECHPIGLTLVQLLGYLKYFLTTSGESFSVGPLHHSQWTPFACVRI